MDKFLIKKPRSATSTPETSVEVPSEIPVEPNPTPTTSTNTIRKGKGRSFQSSWEKTFMWVEYDQESDKVFCKTCKKADSDGLFMFSTKREATFISTGFSNWKKALEKFKAHEKTDAHKEAVMKLARSSKPSIATQLNEHHNSEIKRARSALMIIFTTLRTLCRQGLAVRGHDDFNSNLMQILELRKQDVPDFNNWMGRSGYTFTSHDIQNEIIEMLGSSVLRTVLSDIKKNKYFSIMVDETQDCSIREQVSFCVRTVDSNFEIIENFLGLYVTPNQESQTLFSIVNDIFVRLDLSFSKLRGQCYDGASNMSGAFKGLQRLVLDKQPKAIYVHCSAHSLNLAVEDSLRHLVSMRNAMCLAKDLINTVRESPKRMHIFRSICKEASSSSPEDCSGLRPLCPTRWTMRASSVASILKNYQNLLNFFETFSEEDTSDAGFKCAGYLEKMLQFETYFNFSLYCHLMNVVEECNTKVQSPHLTATTMQMIFSNLLCIIMEKRGGFDQFWADCLQKKPPSVHEPILCRKRRIPKRLENDVASAPFHFETPKDFFKASYIESCDTVQSCVSDRFSATGLSTVTEVEEEMMRIIKNPQGNFSLNKAKVFFQGDIDTDRLLLHLKMLGDIVKQKNINIASMWDVKTLLADENNALKDLLNEVVDCIHILRTVPVTSVTSERSFSSLRRLKSYLRSTMGQKRLNNLAVMLAHREILDALDLRPIINDFISRSSVRRSTFALF